VSRRRGGERGLSIIEAIVIATITALLALLIMPLLPRASAGSFAVAERGVDTLDSMRAEREFRTLVRAVSMRAIDGEPQTVIEGAANRALLHATLPEQASCARAGSPLVQLAVERNALICTSEGRRRVLLRWRSKGVGALSYSADGASWVANWMEAEVPPYVRFEVRDGARVQSSWVERIIGEAP
jgi:hypothetical protein